MADKSTNQSEERLSALEREVAVLRASLDYAVYGIGNPHPDPRDTAKTEDQ